MVVRGADQSRVIYAASCALLVAALAVLLLTALGRGVDWYGTYRPAVRALAAGGMPYTAATFYNPPWALLPLLPLAWLPPLAGRAGMLALAVGALVYAAHRAGANTLATLLFLTTPPVAVLLFTGNVDWLVLVGFILPARWGVFLALVKPQVGGALAVYWLVEAWRRGKVRAVAETFAPVSAALLLVGFAWLRARPMDLAYALNASLFPVGLPVGAALLAYALVRREPRAAWAASPFFAPYLAPHSWSGALLAIVRRPFVLAAVAAGFWTLFALAGGI